MQFSIVIPTKDRAGKLSHALRSALAQRHHDFEVIVSNNQSQDDTEKTVLAHSHARLRYVRAPRSMSVVDHWEFALGQACGDWVLFLCDDDALMPGALASLEAAIAANRHIELFQYDVINFVYDDGTARKGNYVDVPAKIPQRVSLCDSFKCLQRNFRRLSGDMPKFLNAAVSARLIQHIKEQYGRMFWDWAPDYAAATLLLANTRHYARTSPLVLWGENMESYGAGSARNPAHLQKFLKQFESFTGDLPNSPFPNLLTVQNCVYDTFCRVRDLLGPESSRLPIDPIRFRQILAKDCRRYLENGHQEYSAALNKLSQEIANLRRWRLKSPSWVGESLFYGLLDTGHRCTRSIGRRLTGQQRKTRRYFPNIAAAAEYVGEYACPVEAVPAVENVVTHRAAA